MYKEKAKELFDQMYSVSDPLNKYPMCFDTAKACALIAVNELVNSMSVQQSNEVMYWQKVTKEIQKL